MNFREIYTLLSEEFGAEIILEAEEKNTPSSITVDPLHLVEIGRFLQANPQLYFDYLACITALDNGSAAGTLEVIYNLTSIPYQHDLMLRVIIPRNQPSEPLPVVPSVAEIWRTADWHEREAYDLVGIHFSGHPDLRRILLPEDWDGHPLRKDYENQEIYHGIRVNFEDRNRPAQDLG